jgi:hypothetical protein
MSSAYHVVYGEDVLKNITVRKRDVRNQCERELKGKLLHLRAEYLNLRGDTKGLTNLIDRSLWTFRLIFIGALYLKDITFPKETEVLMKSVCNEYGLDITLFERLHAIARGTVKIDEKETDTLFDLYVEELDKLSNAFDSLILSEE